MEVGGRGCLRTKPMEDEATRDPDREFPEEGHDLLEAILGEALPIEFHQAVPWFDLGRAARKLSLDRHEPDWEAARHGRPLYRRDVEGDRVGGEDGWPRRLFDESDPQGLLQFFNPLSSLIEVGGRILR